MIIETISQETYDELLEIYNKFPALTLQNIGYEEINRSLFSAQEKRADKRVNEILMSQIGGFVKFQNFKTNNPKKELKLRFHYQYDSSFTGVGYISLDELLNGFDTKE